MGPTAETIDLTKDTRPSFIYITGADGTGKSTQSRLLVQHLRGRGIQCQRRWLRYPFFFSAPLLAYARWRGYSWYEVTNGVRHGYWDFRSSRMLRALLPWILLLDATLAAVGKIYIPLWLGKTIICERFVLDMLVDLAAAFDNCSLHSQIPGRLYMHLVPHDAAIIILDLDAETIRERRPDLLTDRRLKARLNAFRRLSADLSITVYSSREPVAELNRRILQVMGITDES